MFLRISGSSSMTRIFFMFVPKDGKSDCHGCALTNPALHVHLSAVQFGAAFHQKQAQAGARTAANVATAMKGLEKLLLVLFSDADPTITHDAYGVRSVTLHGEMHRCPGLRVFHCVTEEVCENMSQQGFICLGMVWDGVKR